MFSPYEAAGLDAWKQGVRCGNQSGKRRWKKEVGLISVFCF